VRITKEQLQRLMDGDDEPKTICIHDAQIVHLHPTDDSVGKHSAFLMRFAGHIPEDNPDASPDTPFPDDALMAVDLFISRSYLMDIIADMTTELRDASTCDEVRHAGEQTSQVIMDSLDDFLHKLTGNGENTHD
jgi:hypothetical protein